MPKDKGKRVSVYVVEFKGRTDPANCWEFDSFTFYRRRKVAEAVAKSGQKTYGLLQFRIRRYDRASRTKGGHHAKG